MKMIKITLIVLAVLVLIIIAIYAYYGGFHKINFQEVNRENEVLVYEEMVGDYGKCGPIMDSIYYSLLNDFKIETYNGFGLFYDDPKKVSKENLHSDIGCILEKSDSSRIEEVSQKFKVKTIEGGPFIETQFPHKGMMSVLVGIMRVYPSLDKFLAENGYAREGALMEIYDTPNHLIIYRTKFSKK